MTSKYFTFSDRKSRDVRTCCPHRAVNICTRSLE